MVNKLLYKPSVKDIMYKYYEMSRGKNSGNKKDFFNSPDSPEHSDQDSDTDGWTRLRRSRGLNEDEWVTVSRNDIKLDMLIWLSESSLSGLFSEVSLIRDNHGREFKGNSLIIKRLDNQGMKILIITDNQGFHQVSPMFSNSPDDSPDQALNRIKI